MDDLPLVWDRANRRHLTRDHPERLVSISDIEEVLADSSRDQRYDPVRDSYPVLGRTGSGRWLIVV